MPEVVIQPLTSEQIRCFVTVKHSLSTHRLSKEDIIFAADYVAQRYGRSLEKSKSSRSRRSRDDSEITEENLINFLTLSYRRGLCKYALTFNRELDRAIQDKDLALMDSLLKEDINAFVEIYDNDLLNAQDKAYLTRRLTHELLATADMFKSNEGITHASHAKCLDRACHKHAEVMELDPVRRVFLAVEGIPETFCIQDENEGKKCFPLLETIALLLTGRLDRMTEQFKNLIRTSYRLEVAMYERYLMGYEQDDENRDKATTNVPVPSLYRTG